MKNIQGQINAVALDKSKQKNILTEFTKKFDKLREANIVAKSKWQELSSTEDLESVNVQSLVSYIIIFYQLQQFLEVFCRKMRCPN